MTFLKKKKSSGNIRQSIFDLRAFPGFFIYKSHIFTALYMDTRFCWFNFWLHEQCSVEQRDSACCVISANVQQNAAYDSEYIKLHKQSKRKIFLSISPSEKHYIKFGCPKSKSSCQNSFARFISQMEHVMAAIWQS